VLDTTPCVGVAIPGGAQSISRRKKRTFRPCYCHAAVVTHTAHISASPVWRWLPATHGHPIAVVRLRTATSAVAGGARAGARLSIACLRLYAHAVSLISSVTPRRAACHLPRYCHDLLRGTRTGAPFGRTGRPQRTPWPAYITSKLVRGPRACGAALRRNALRRVHFKTAGEPSRWLAWQDAL